MASLQGLSPDDASALLSVSGELWLAGEGFRARLARSVRALTSADVVTIDGFDAGTGERSLLVDPPEWNAAIRERRPHLYRNLMLHPVALAMLDFESTGVRLLSDVIELDEWRATRLYRDYYEPLGLTWEMIIPVPVGGGGITIITVDSTRSFSDPSADFTARDRAICEALVPTAVLGFGGLPEGASAGWSGIASGWYLVRHDARGVVSRVLPPDPCGVLAPGMVLPSFTDEDRAAPGGTAGTLRLSDGDWRVHRYISSSAEELVAMQRLRDIPPDLSRLTERQRETLALMARGLTNGQIATELGIAEGTARKHVEMILRTLNAGNRAAATAMWYAHIAAIPLYESHAGRSQRGPG